MTKDALDDFPSKQEILKTISDAVYAQYPKKEWQGLSNDRIREIGDNCLENNNGLFNWIDFARAIEQALKEKNT